MIELALKSIFTFQMSSAPPPVLRFKRLSPYAVPPMRSTSGAAGYDLCSARDVVIGPHSHAVVFTDLAFSIPDGCYGRVAPRSGLAVKFFIDVGAGVIDPDYRGNVGVVIFNFSAHNFNIRQGDRIAQLILERNITPETMDCDSLSDTERGEGGFGSTGIATPKTAL